MCLDFAICWLNVPISIFNYIVLVFIVSILSFINISVFSKVDITKIHYLFFVSKILVVVFVLVVFISMVIVVMIFIFLACIQRAKF